MDPGILDRRALGIVELGKPIAVRLLARVGAVGVHPEVDRPRVHLHGDVLRGGADLEVDRVGRPRPLVVDVRCSLPLAPPAPALCDCIALVGRHGGAYQGGAISCSLGGRRGGGQRCEHEARGYDLTKHDCRPDFFVQVQTCWAVEDHKAHGQLLTVGWWPSFNS